MKGKVLSDDEAEALLEDPSLTEDQARSIDPGPGADIRCWMALDPEQELRVMPGWELSVPGLRISRNGSAATRARELLRQSQCYHRMESVDRGWQITATYPHQSVEVVAPTEQLATARLVLVLESRGLLDV